MREGAELASTVSQAKDAAESDLEAGLGMIELEHTARQLLQNGQFEDSEEEIPLVMEEFYPEESPTETTQPIQQPVTTNTRTQTRSTKLTEKLGSRTQ